MRFCCHICAVLVLTGVTAGVLWAQTPKGTQSAGAKAPPFPESDVELVERLLAARRQYQVALEQLRAHYISASDAERARWAEEELLSYHRHSLKPFNLGLDVPPPTLKPEVNIPEANQMYQRAMGFKEKGRSGWSNDGQDNYRRAELLFQQLITIYPQCTKIDEAAFQLGEIYESKYYRQNRRAAVYYERCFQWNPKTQFDARLRAARLYDKVLVERGRAVELYEEVLRHETNPKWQQEAQARLAQLRGGK